MTLPFPSSSHVSYSVVQLDLGHAPEPRHILSRHTLPVTDLHCGLMGVQARVATASLDQTVKVTLCKTTMSVPSIVSTAAPLVSTASCLSLLLPA